MPNLFRSGSDITITGSIFKGPFTIAVETSSILGPTVANTGFYNGITPPSGGYCVYAVKSVQGPSIRVANNDASLITIAQQYGATGASTASLSSSLDFFQSNNYVVTNFDYENIVTNGLTYLLDAGFIPSYPLSSSVWYNLSSIGSSTSLVNGPTYNSSNSGSIVFNGTTQYALTSNLLNPTTFPNESVFVWFYPISSGCIVSELGQASVSGTWHDSNIEINSSGLISFATWGGSLVNKVVSSAKSFNTWYNLGFTYSGTTLTAYINGASIGTTTFTRQTTSSLYYGLCSTDITNMGASGPASGRLGNFIFYNRGLSATEVLQNYNAQKGRFGL